MAPPPSADAILEFWNERASLGSAAGSQDIAAKELEIEVIASFVHDGIRVLDVGCGNGVTAVELSSRFAVDLVGVDFAEKMVEQAARLADGRHLKGTVRFEQGCLPELDPRFTGFDLVYTQRCLINLADVETQRASIEAIAGALAPGGIFVMCECCWDGLERLNVLRRSVGLKEIKPPWHNRYLRESEVEEWARGIEDRLTLIEKRDFSSAYYFISRVVNAWMADRKGEQPDYNAPINELGRKLPPLLEGYGQSVAWVWRKTAEPVVRNEVNVRVEKTENTDDAR